MLVQQIISLPIHGFSTPHTLGCHNVDIYVALAYKVGRRGKFEVQRLRGTNFPKLLRAMIFKEESASTFTMPSPSSMLINVPLSPLFEPSMTLTCKENNIMCDNTYTLAPNMLVKKKVIVDAV